MDFVFKFSADNTMFGMQSETIRNQNEYARYVL